MPCDTHSHYVCLARVLCGLTVLTFLSDVRPPWGIESELTRRLRASKTRNSQRAALKSMCTRAGSYAILPSGV